MANIMDYMDWRGDLSFEADEFNEVDNLILAQLAYVDFEGIVTAEENAPAVPLKEASGQFWEKNDKDEILAGIHDEIGPVCYGENGGNKTFFGCKTTLLCQ